MTTLAITYLGVHPLWQQLSSARDVLFWLMLGGFIWVIGDVFQQYAAKYVGISRGIPLSNSNQLWGLLWGVLVFGELRGSSASTYAQVIGGSLLMMLGVGAIAFSSATSKEQEQWRQAARREGKRYGIDADFVEARMQGKQMDGEARPARRMVDWLLVAMATAVFVFFAAMARAPGIAIHWEAVTVLSAASLILLVVCGWTLWKTTGFR
jgi:hypothetical protein